MAAANLTGEALTGPLRLQVDRKVKPVLRGAQISSDDGLPLQSGLDRVLGPTDAAAGVLGDSRTGRNGRPRLAGPLDRRGARPPPAARRHARRGRFREPRPRRPAAMRAPAGRRARRRGPAGGPAPGAGVLLARGSARDQRRPASVRRAGLQPCDLPACAGDHRELVGRLAAPAADRDRRPAGSARPLRRVPVCRGRLASGDLRERPRSHRRVARPVGPGGVSMVGAHSITGGGVRGDGKGVCGIPAFQRRRRIAEPVGRRVGSVHGPDDGGRAVFRLVGPFGAGRLVGERMNGESGFGILAGPDHVAWLGRRFAQPRKTSANSTLRHP